MEWIVFIGYVLLLALIVLVQPAWRVGRVIRRHDKLHLLMGFKFFYPNPIDGDHIIYYRVQQPGAVMGEWTELIVPARNPWLSWLFGADPQAFVLHRLTAFMNATQKGQSRERSDYRHLLAHLRHISGDPEAIQFRVMERQIHNLAHADRLLFESPLHHIVE